MNKMIRSKENDESRKKKVIRNDVIEDLDMASVVKRRSSERRARLESIAKTNALEEKKKLESSQKKKSLEKGDIGRKKVKKRKVSDVVKKKTISNNEECNGSGDIVYENDININSDSENDVVNGYSNGITEKAKNGYSSSDSKGENSTSYTRNKIRINLEEITRALEEMDKVTENGSCSENSSGFSDADIERLKLHFIAGAKQKHEKSSVNKFTSSCHGNSSNNSEDDIPLKFLKSNTEKSSVESTTKDATADSTNQISETFEQRVARKLEERNKRIGVKSSSVSTTHTNTSSSSNTVSTLPVTEGHTTTIERRCTAIPSKESSINRTNCPSISNTVTLSQSEIINISPEIQITNSTIDKDKYKRQTSNANSECPSIGRRLQFPTLIRMPSETQNTPDSTSSAAKTRINSSHSLNSNIVSTNIASTNIASTNRHGDQGSDKQLTTTTIVSSNANFQFMHPSRRMFLQSQNSSKGNLETNSNKSTLTNTVKTNSNSLMPSVTQGKRNDNVDRNVPHHPSLRLSNVLGKPDNTSSGRIRPDNASSGSTRPENASSGSIRPVNAFSGSTRPDNDFSGRTRPDNTFSGRTQLDNAISGRIRVPSINEKYSQNNPEEVIPVRPHPFAKQRKNSSRLLMSRPADTYKSLEILDSSSESEADVIISDTESESSSSSEDLIMTQVFHISSDEESDSEVVVSTNQNTPLINDWTSRPVAIDTSSISAVNGTSLSALNNLVPQMYTHNDVECFVISSSDDDDDVVLSEIRLKSKTPSKTSITKPIDKSRITEKKTSRQWKTNRELSDVKRLETKKSLERTAKSVTKRQMMKLAAHFKLVDFKVKVVNLNPESIERIIDVCTVRPKWNNRDYLLKAGLDEYDVIRLGLEGVRIKTKSSRYTFRRFLRKTETYDSTLNTSGKDKKNSKELDFLKSEKLKKKEKRRRKILAKQKKQNMESIRRALIKINARYSNQSKFWKFLDRGTRAGTAILL